MTWKQTDWGWYHTETGEQCGPGHVRPSPHRHPTLQRSQRRRQHAKRRPLPRSRADDTTRESARAAVARSSPSNTNARAARSSATTSPPCSLSRSHRRRAVARPKTSSWCCRRGRKTNATKRVSPKQLLEALAPSHLVDGDPPLKIEELDFSRQAPARAKALRRNGFEDPATERQRQGRERARHAVDVLRGHAWRRGGVLSQPVCVVLPGRGQRVPPRVHAWSEDQSRRRPCADRCARSSGPECARMVVVVDVNVRTVGPNRLHAERPTGPRGSRSP